MPRVCDYEGSRYRTEFWEGRNREYEDRVERVAMQKLLPPRGGRLIEVGAGFGRLTDLYQGYDEIILMDYARSQLEQAQNHIGPDDRFTFVVADIYTMPFVDHLFDALTMIRVMHHLTDVPAALAELYRIVRPDGTAVIEYASKFHLKSLLRWLGGRQDWRPFDHAPVEFVELNFDFHPLWMHQKFEAAGFRLENIRTLSHYRLDVLKRIVPTSWLVALDRLLQPTGNWFQLSPSVFVQVQAQKPMAESATGFFRCPTCGSPHLSRKKTYSEQAGQSEIFLCPGCRQGWSHRAGIYDFKTPVPVA